MCVGGARRFLLQEQLKSKQGQEELDLRPPDTGDFRMKIIDVNRTSKGARAGRVQGVSALVVVGNNDVTPLLTPVPFHTRTFTTSRTGE